MDALEHENEEVAIFVICPYCETGLLPIRDGEQVRGICENGHVIVLERSEYYIVVYEQQKGAQ